MRSLRGGPPAWGLVEELTTPHRKKKKTVTTPLDKIIILPVVFYGCETWSFTLREEHRLRVFENKVLRKIFGAKKDEITGEWRKLYNAESYMRCILRLT